MSGDSNTIRSFNFNREKMLYLLRRLSLGTLDTEGARELIPLLNEEKTIKNQNTLYVEEISKMIKILEHYIAGEINLYSGIKDIKFSNID